jgi:hypothetical protein
MATGKFTIEPDVADALLDVGVSVPLKTLRIPFTGKTVKLRVTMRRPCLGNQIRISRAYLSMGITYEELESSGVTGRLRFMARYGNTVSLIVALTLCRGWLTGVLLARPVAWLLRWFVEDVYMEAAYEKFVSLLATQAFRNTIKSAEAANLLSPMNLSRMRKRS